jgi:DNA-binding NarL/FixJ family response regulator
MHDSSALIEKSLQLGASGFINKQAGAEELFEGIRTVLAGRRFLCSHSQKMFVRGKLGLAADLSPLDELSKREFEIFVRLAEGQATRDIADSLSVSPKTVANQRLRIFEKLKVKSVVELYKLALHYRILPDEFVE